MRGRVGERILWLVACAGLLGSVGALAALHGERVVASYSTSLRGRSAGQVRNALRAAAAADGAVIAPGAVFSFNERVGPWTADAGYVKAPVSFGGELVPAWGGGVCQTSTTIYNAALLAGFEIVERHRHAWPTTYAPVGRDAAVAYGNLDLRFRNTLGVPARLRVYRAGERLVCEIRARGRPEFSVRVVRNVHAVVPPALVIEDDPALPEGVRQVVCAGRPGYTVSVVRAFYRDGEEVRSERISLDSYPAMHRVIRVGTGRGAGGRSPQ